MYARRFLPVLSAFALVFALGAGTASPQQAQPAAVSPTYTVEVIVFRALGALGTAENWATEDKAATTGATPGAPEDDTPVANASAVSGRLVGALPATEFKLGEIEAKLRASGGYAPIAHAAWQQTASPWGSKIVFPLDKLGLEAAGLSGSIALERGQYLHLGLDLDYAPASAPPALGAGAGTVFVLNESRRVKFFERNYFDHPAFGVIALVTPVQGARPGR